MTKCLVLLILLLNSCSLNSNDRKEKLSDMQKDLFEDVNLFTLEGLRKIEKFTEYPYIEVQKVNEKERNIIYHGSKEMVFSREYKRLNEIWFTSYTTNGDTCNIITYEYVTPIKIIDLYYCYNKNTNDTVLTDVEVYESSTEIKYNLGNERGITPSIHVVDLAKAKSRSIFSRQISIKEGILVMKEQERTNTNQILSEETNCYVVDSHSYFWWRYFGWLAKKIDCK